MSEDASEPETSLQITPGGIVLVLFMAAAVNQVDKFLPKPEEPCLTLDAGKSARDRGTSTCVSGNGAQVHIVLPPTATPAEIERARAVAKEAHDQLARQAGNISAPSTPSP